MDSEIILWKVWFCSVNKSPSHVASNLNTALFSFVKISCDYNADKNNYILHFIDKN